MYLGDFLLAYLFHVPIVSSIWDKVDLIDLSTISNVNRSPETWDLLEKLSKGIVLIYNRDRRIVSCQNNCKSMKVYVLSYLMNVDCGMHEQSLIQGGLLRYYFFFLSLPFIQN